MFDWLAAAGLAACALCLFQAGRRADIHSRTSAAGWYGLAGIALFLALDGPLHLHRAIRLLRGVYKPGGSSTSNFFLLAVVAGAIVFCAYLPFLVRLPARPRILLLAGAALFFAGLVGGKALALGFVGHGRLLARLGVEPVRLALKLAGAALAGCAAVCCHARVSPAPRRPY